MVPVSSNGTPPGYCDRGAFYVWLVGWLAGDGPADD
jgi:hypothetical protein